MSLTLLCISSRVQQKSELSKDGKTEKLCFSTWEEVKIKVRIMLVDLNDDTIIKGKVARKEQQGKDVKKVFNKVCDRSLL